MNKFANFKIRFSSGITLFAMALLVIFLTNQMVFAIFLALIYIIAAYESISLIKLQSKFAKICYLFLFTIGLFTLYQFQITATINMVIIFYCIVWLSIIASVILYPKCKWWNRCAFLSFWTYITLLVGWYGIYVTRSLGSPILVMYMILFISFADVGAYFSGKLFGKKPLSIKISPGKTLEGALGGTITAILLGYFLILNENVSLLINVLVMTLIVWVSIIGDLFISMLKRNVSLKDTGKLLPGHGGLLDRIDSITAASLPFALFVSIIPVAGG